ncbi:MAG: ISNCY family transposase [Candidatus Solibacter sp.]|nr:ISNCY family transposase [Candidatus Solibacter sp.]
MTQADRDRLVTLKKAKKRLITQREAAEELGLSIRQVKRLLKELKKRGDRVVIHGLRGKPSNAKIDSKMRQKTVVILSLDVYRGFGPTLASEYLAKKHGIHVSRETARKWMKESGLWRGKRRRTEVAHPWRQRRSRCGELVQWDTSEHDWLEGRGSEQLYLISMIDDATSRLYARFVRSDSSEENMRTLWGYVEMYGLPLAWYTDKASHFRNNEKRRRDEPGVDQDPAEMPPTQIGRALRELDTNWIAAHSPQAKGRVERSFDTAQDRLVKGMRVAGVKTLQQANEYLEKEFLPWWNRTLTVQPASADDAHRRLDKRYDLAAILSHVETRQVKNDYTIQFEGQRYGIQAESISTGLRGGEVRVEKRLDGTVAFRFRERYLSVTLCTVTPKAAAEPKAAARNSGKCSQKRQKSGWMEGFWEKPGPPLGKAIEIANATS